MFENFDKSKTYIGLQDHNTDTSLLIKKYSKCYCDGCDFVPNHVMAIRYMFNEWWVYESSTHALNVHNLPSGVRHYPMSKFLEIEDIKEYHFFPLELEERQMELLIGTPYGFGDIRKLLGAYYTKRNGAQTDSKGLICSEYIANCYKPICEYFNLPTWSITPAHFLKYVTEIGIKEVKHE